MNKQSQRKLTVASFDIAAALTIQGSDQFIDALVNSSFWQEFVPGFAADTPLEPISHWTVHEHTETSYDLDSHTINATLSTIIPIIVIIEAEFEQLRQMRGLYTMHGSCIGRDDMAVGLIGAISGIGKTSLCAQAAKQGWTWLSDEKFTINPDMDIIGGVSSVLNDDKTHRSRAGLRPAPDGKQRPLKLLCIPIVTTETTATTHELDQARREWQCYDEITRDIRQINGVLRGFTTPLPSFDTTEISKNRQTYGSQLADSVPIVFVRGNEQAILETIESIC
jgi:hypothetical protein